jgi:hypothetical protein
VNSREIGEPGEEDEGRICSTPLIRTSLALGSQSTTMKQSIVVETLNVDAVVWRSAWKMSIA